MNIAMTGATGYIGKHLSNYLRKGRTSDHSSGKVDVSRRYVRLFDSDTDPL